MAPSQQPCRQGPRSVVCGKSHGTIFGAHPTRRAAAKIHGRRPRGFHHGDFHRCTMVHHGDITGEFCIRNSGLKPIKDHGSSSVSENWGLRFVAGLEVFSLMLKPWGKAKNAWGFFLGLNW